MRRYFEVVQKINNFLRFHTKKQTKLKHVLAYIFNNLFATRKSENRFKVLKGLL